MGQVEVDRNHELAPDFVFWPSQGIAQNLVNKEIKSINYSGSNNTFDIVNGREVVSFGEIAPTENYVFQNIGAGQYTFITSTKTGDQADAYEPLAAVGSYSPAFYTRIGSGSWGIYSGGLRTADTALAANTWYCLSIVRESTASGGLKFYVDGESDGSARHASSWNESVISFGSNINQGGAYFYDGDIEYGFLYRRALTQEQIVSLKRDPYQFLKSKRPLFVFVPSTTGQLISASGIASAEAFGTHTLAPGTVAVLPAGIASAEAHGAQIIVPGLVSIAPTAIASVEAFGGPSVVVGALSLLPTGIASAEALGTATLTRGAVSIDPAGIVSAEAFGAAGVLSGGSLIAAFGIASAEAVGALVVQPGAVSVTPSGIDTGEAFGGHEIAHGAILLAPAGITSGEWFGDSLIIPQLTVIEPAGVVTGEVFGTLTIVGGAQLLGWLIAEIQARAALEGTIAAPPGLGADIRINWDG